MFFFLRKKCEFLVAFFPRAKRREGKRAGASSHKEREKEEAEKTRSEKEQEKEQEEEEEEEERNKGRKGGKKTHPGGDPISFETVCLSMNSDMSSLTMASSEPK